MSVTPERPPLVAALLFLATIAVWSTALLTDATTLPTDVARSAGAAAWVAGIVTLVGLLLARGRWAQRTALLLVIGAILPAAWVESEVLFWVGVVVAAGAGVALLVGPMPGWIRPGRSMEAPPDSAVVLMLILVLWPLFGAPLIGDPLGLLLWAGPGLAFWYGRATVSGLWAARLGSTIPLVSAVGADLTGWVLAAAIAAATAWWAWKADTRLAVLPLTGRPSSGVCPTPDFERILRGGDA